MLIQEQVPKDAFEAVEKDTYRINVQGETVISDNLTRDVAS